MLCCFVFAPAPADTHSQLSKTQHIVQHAVQIPRVRHSPTRPAVFVEQHRVAARALDTPGLAGRFVHAVCNLHLLLRRRGVVVVVSVQELYALGIQDAGIPNAACNQRRLGQVAVAELEGQAQVLETEGFACAARVSFDGEFGGGAAAVDGAVFAGDAALEGACADVAGAVGGDFAEQRHEGFFDVGFGRDVEVFGAVGGVALGEAEFVACGQQAVGDGRGGGEFVRFGEEGGGVAFADFEVPVWGWGSGLAGGMQLMWWTRWHGEKI